MAAAQAGPAAGAGSGAGTAENLPPIRREATPGTPASSIGAPLPALAPLFLLDAWVAVKCALRYDPSPSLASGEHLQTTQGARSGPAPWKNYNTGDATAGFPQWDLGCLLSLA